MKTYGLTGGVGMGKSTVADCLRQRGLPVMDTDVLARELVEPGQPALAEIAHAFGSEFIGEDGRLLRDKLAGVVFNDATERARLESILHPRITARWRDAVAEWRRQNLRAAVVVIPLLFETGVEAEFDAVICVACSPSTQQARLADRGWTQEEISRRNAAQWPVERKIACARHVVWNDGGKELLAQQLDRILPAGGGRPS